MKRVHSPPRTNIEVILGERFNVVMPLYRGILAFAREQYNWKIRLRAFGRDRAHFGDDENEADGTLALCPSEDVKLLRTLLKRNRPVVTFYGDVPHEVLPTVVMDELAIGRAAAIHLLSRGFRNFAYCGSEMLCSRQREQGFAAVVVEAGYPPPTPLDGTGVEGRPTWPEVRHARLVRWLRRLPTPVGIMSHNDLIGTMVLEAAMTVKLRVPEQCAVVGMDNDEVTCELAPVPLSSVDTDLPAMGYAAAKLMHHLLGGEPPPPTPPVIGPRGVIVRASSDVLAFRDADLREAVRLIRERGGDGLSGPKLAQALSISRRSLQNKFQRELHCRPRDEIRQARLAKVCALLVETDLRMREVARKVGYTNLPQLCSVFKRQFGITLSEYRRRSHRAAHPQPTGGKRA